VKRIALLFVALVIAASAVQAQTITPALAWTTSDAVAKVTTYTTTLQIGTGAVTQVTPACVSAGTGASCLLSPVAFNANAPTTFRVVVIDPATGLSASGTLNYTPGQPPGTFTVTLQWKVTVP
jgi:hypothetical protein